MNIVLKQEIFDRITEVCLETFSAGEMCRAEEMLMKLMDIQECPCTIRIITTLCRPRC